MRRLVDLLADPEAPARADAALAIGQAGSEGGLLVLRLKARLGDPEPPVIGQVFSSLLALDGSEAVSFLEPFLDGDDLDARGEAAAVLAGSHLPAALEVLRRAWRGKLDPETRASLLAGLTASPAGDFRGLPARSRQAGAGVERSGVDVAAAQSLLAAGGGSAVEGSSGLPAYGAFAAIRPSRATAKDRTKLYLALNE